MLLRKSGALEEISFDFLQSIAEKIHEQKYYLQQ
jgi:hypothetical protein